MILNSIQKMFIKNPVFNNSKHRVKCKIDHQFGPIA
jgi:hypothetical protein